jgi:hypothetical protein
MATLILFMLCGRGAQQFDRTNCGFAVEYTDIRASCQLKRPIFVAPERTLKLPSERLSISGVDGYNGFYAAREIFLVTVGYRELP